MMQLSQFTDYSFRVLIVLAQQQQLTSVDQVATTLNVSSHHLKKVVYKLALTGYVESFKGRGGGIRLAKEPNDINLGQVIHDMEESLNVVECFADPTRCTLTCQCKLKFLVNDALQAFLAEFHKKTLADLL